MSDRVVGRAWVLCYAWALPCPLPNGQLLHGILVWLIIWLIIWLYEISLCLSTIAQMDKLLGSGQASSAIGGLHYVGDLSRLRF